MDPTVAEKNKVLWAKFVTVAEKIGHVENRGKRAFQFWTEQADKSTKLDAAAKQKLKALIADLPKIVSAAKQVQKEILVVEKDVFAAKPFSGTPKQFREQVYDKKMPTAKALEPLADKFVRGMTTLAPKGSYPGKGSALGGVNADAVSTVNALIDYLGAYRSFRAQVIKMT